MTSLFIQETISDEKLPQMGELMNASRMREIFERELIAAGDVTAIGRIEGCQVIYVKYRPGRNCVVSYRLKISGLETGEVKEQSITALACWQGESHAMYASAQKQSCVSTALGVGLIHLPALETVVWVYPNDRKLTGLAALADSDCLRCLVLPEVVDRGFGNELKIAELTSDLVHYAPERTCTVRVKVGLCNTRTGESESHVLFGKTYCLDEGEAAWKGQQHLWESEARRGGQLLIPQPLAYQVDFKTLWQTGLEGRSLFEYDPQSASFHELLSGAGAAVAALHQIRTPFAPLVTTKGIVIRLKAAEKLLSHIRSPYHEKLRSVVNRLADASDYARAASMATLHGDLHLKNFFVVNDGIALVDLDSLCQGDPLQDVGSFVAALHYRGLLEGRSFNVTEKISGQFIEGYSENAKWKVSEPALYWHIAAALIYERAYRCVTRLKAGRLDILDEIIELARTFSTQI